MISEQFKSGIIDPDDLILVTGAAGFIGKYVISNLVGRNFRNIRCLIRHSTKPEAIQFLMQWSDTCNLELVVGNLLSLADCKMAVQNARIVLHLAAGRGEKSIPDAYLNSVVTTRNLLSACAQSGIVKRFVNVSSFAVYTNRHKPQGCVLDENCPVERQPHERGDAYCYAKVKQDEMVETFGNRHGIPYVIVRPGAVYGPGNLALPGRVGIGTFGLFLHLGGSSKIPLNYVENCADAIVMAAVIPEIDGEVFNLVDDDLPTSRMLLRRYKKEVRRFKSVYLPKGWSYGLCMAWECYSRWSRGQLPPAFNRKRWYANWKKTAYSNQKLRTRLVLTQRVSTEEGLRRFFAACREEHLHA